MDFQVFLHQTAFADLDEPVVGQAKRCLLDLVGVMAAGSRTRLSQIICDHAANQFGAAGDTGFLMFDGRRASACGAALANGMMIDSIDAHDGYKPSKGHVGCHVLPALLAYSGLGEKRSGKSFLADLVTGYEIGSRLGAALHASVPDYHTSGAWGAVTAAALGSRMLQLDPQQTRHAMGIGEYHGPRSQMMRVIDHPTMLKDGSGWGAMAGVSATLLARAGFTGAPAITVEGGEVASFWADLGHHWLILEQYFKPYPVCRWAQPAAAAALALTNEHSINHTDISAIEVFSFHEACRLATREPADTEQAQYSLPFPVAAALVHGAVGPAQIDGDGLRNEDVLRLSRSMVLSETDAYNRAFPQERFAHVKVTLHDGREFVSQTCRADGDPETPLSNDAIVSKYHSLADPVLGKARSSAIRETIETLEGLDDINTLAELLIPPA